MSLTTRVVAYCERTGPGFWAEPANALTNLSFAVAAWLLWRALRNMHNGEGDSWPASISVLPALLGLIALCSFLFHTLAQVWAELADQLSILLFGCVFLYAFLRHVARLPSAVAVAAAVAFTVLSYYMPRWLPPGFLNQSGAYFPYVIGLTGIALWLRTNGRAGWTSVAGATLLFCLSLALRTVDKTVCAAMPLGTHFLWHLLNGVVLFILALAVAREAVTTKPVDRAAAARLTGILRTGSDLGREG